MSDVLAALLRGASRSVSDESDSPTDDLFDPLGGLAADPAGAKEARTAGLLAPRTPSEKRAAAREAALEAALADEAAPAPSSSSTRPAKTGSKSRDAIATVFAALGDAAALEGGEEAAARTAASIKRKGAPLVGGLADSLTGSLKRLEPIIRPNGQPYLPRHIGEHTDVEALRTCRDQATPVLLAGYPGTGKTAVIEAAFGEELLTVAAHNDLEVGDLIGTWVQSPDQSYRWVDGPLVRAMREGRPLLVDDITLANPGVTARLFPAMDGRNTIVVTEHEGEIVKASPGFCIFGAHNPGIAGAVLTEALSSRFLVQVRVGTDMAMARALGVDAKLVRVAVGLSKRRETGELGWAPEMRELLGFMKVSSMFGTDVAINNLINLPMDDDDRAAVVEALRLSFPEAEPLRIE